MKNNKNIIFETERLMIRKWQDSDADDLYEYASNEVVTKFLTFPTYQSKQEAYDRIAFVKQQYSEDSILGDYCIEHRATNKVIGAITLVHYTPKNQGEVEIGYVLNPKFQGQGFMTECLLGMFQHVKQRQIAKRIILRCDVENVKSSNVMKRAGMTFEGILRKAGENNFHARHDIALYSILDEEIKEV